MIAHGAAARPGACLDALAAGALASDLRRVVGGARVQAVLQLDRLTVALELYAGARWYLVLSADPSHEGLLLSADRARRGEGEPTPLTLAMRSRLVGARLGDVRQPPLERALWFRFDGATAWHLVAELTGRLANLVLLDDARTIIALARPVTSAMTRARTVLPGRVYVPPPVPAKVVPDAVTSSQISSALGASGDAPAWRALVGLVRGVSPMAAREIVYRADGDADAQAMVVDAPSLHRALGAFFAAAAGEEWSPTTARSAAGVVAWAAYELRHLVDADAPVTVEPTASTLDALAAFVSAGVAHDPYHAARAALQRRLDAARAILSRRSAAIRRELAGADELDDLRLCGDLILAWQREIARGATSFVPPAEAGRCAPILLDASLDAVGNAQAYYRRYRRKRRALAESEARIAEVAIALATLDQLSTDLAMAEDRGGIDAVGDALACAAPTTAPPRTSRRAPAAQPLELQSSDGFTLLVGRNSQENEVVTFARSARGDVWLHARGVPGGHVVVKASGRAVPTRTLLEAASLAAWYSRARGEASATVSATDVRHVRRMRGGGAGMVVYDHDETLRVAPRAPDAFRAP